MRNGTINEEEYENETTDGEWNSEYRRTPPLCLVGSAPDPAPGGLLYGQRGRGFAPAPTGRGGIPGAATGEPSELSARNRKTLKIVMGGTHSGHIPVLLEPVVNALTEGGSGRFLDATFGGGGHTRALLDENVENEVVALDCDPEAIERGRALESAYEGRLVLRQMNFSELGSLDEEPFKGILFDFGVSSYHLDDAERGFSFRLDAPLDMRMNPQGGIPASGFLNKASYDQLVEAVRNFGEEPRWRKIVRAIEGARGTERLARTVAFAQLVEEAVGGRRQTDRIHPATRTFQGVRIAVNGELAAIEEALPEAFARLRVGGRLAVISFHSLEDRLVKRFFRRMAGQSEHARDGIPDQFRTRRARLLTRKPLTAEASETEINPRSRSAKLRILEKERAAA